MSYKNPTILLILVASVAAGLGLWLGQRAMSGGDNRATTTIPVQAAVLYPAPKPIAPFTLTASDGAAYTAANLQGQWTLLFFGFTRCPDVCPTTLALFADLEKKLAVQPDSPKVGYTFISVDPERDSPKQAGEYARYFSPSIAAATGEPAQLEAFTRSLGVLYMKSETTPGDYTMDHSAQAVLVGPDATVRGMFRPPLDANRIAADLRLIAENE